MPVFTPTPFCCAFCSPPRGKVIHARELLDVSHEADGESVVPTAAVRAHTARIEVHAVRVVLVAPVGSTRPVVAARADIVHAHIEAGACGREEDSAYYMYFDSDNVNTYSDGRSNGCAVRLVRDVK